MFLKQWHYYFLILILRLYPASIYTNSWILYYFLNTIGNIVFILITSVRNHHPYCSPSNQLLLLAFNCISLEEAHIFLQHLTFQLKVLASLNKLLLVFLLKEGLSLEPRQLLSQCDNSRINQSLLLLGVQLVTHGLELSCHMLHGHWIGRQERLFVLSDNGVYVTVHLADKRLEFHVQIKDWVGGYRLERRGLETSQEGLWEIVIWERFASLCIGSFI